jgi:hypothetical protein
MWLPGSLLAHTFASPCPSRELKAKVATLTLRSYINPKGMIGMPITGRHVWGHAYKHDKGAKVVGTHRQIST